ncbi:olfactory receptor 2AJ1-like [Sciurus carolinensis]|uniref:olfactory receptor 2AJ1-like n=1 Tax=Sciurus carolinensis TaxID=30640 RepID=UPI001FB4DEF0|nr:olfactory receptor 2AJ1-like [Sciurus carolinensis]
MPARFCVFGLISVMFFAMLTGNGLLILLILVDPLLHIPMYFFLWQLSLIDILFTLVIVPKMMSDFLLHKTAISASGCGTQSFLGWALGGTKCIPLGLMSCDQYMTISKPLHYPLLMNWSLCRQMALSSWLSSAFNALVHMFYTMSFPFCGPREIHHFYCEIPGVLWLSCVVTLPFKTGVLISTTILLLVPFSVILASYMLILVTVIHMASAGSFLHLLLSHDHGARNTSGLTSSQVKVYPLLNEDSAALPPSHHSLAQSKEPEVAVCTGTRACACTGASPPEL